MKIHIHTNTTPQTGTQTHSGMHWSTASESMARQLLCEHTHRQVHHMHIWQHRLSRGFVFIVGIGRQCGRGNGVTSFHIVAHLFERDKKGRRSLLDLLLKLWLNDMLRRWLSSTYWTDFGCTMHRKSKACMQSSPAKEHEVPAKAK